MVIWIDNQYMGYLPDGRVRYGLLENLYPVWIEIEAMEGG
jgi:hypothetical protein